MNIITFMERISRREFLLYPYKYLKLGSFIITNRGSDEYVVTIKNIELNYEHQEVGVSIKIPNQYGCECIRVEGKPLCPKHGRY